MLERLLYKLNLPKVTKENSACIHGRVILFINNDTDGKNTKSLIAYDLTTKLQLGVSANNDKDGLVDVLKAKDFERLETAEGALNENSKKVG